MVGFGAAAHHICSGDFVDALHARRVGWAMLALSAAAVVYLFATSPDGMRDAAGRPLGSDFFSFWSAGKLVLAGEPAGAYESARLYTEHQRLLGVESPPFYPFLYPPAFLIFAAAFATMPYVAAWLAWMGTTLAAYFFATKGLFRSAIIERMSPHTPAARAASPSPASGRGDRGEGRQRADGGETSPADHFDQPSPPAPLPLAGEGSCLRCRPLPAESSAKAGESHLAALLILAYPAVLLNFLHGQNGFLIAALFAGGLLALDKRPLVAGVLLGIIALKPQYGILIPIALAAGGHLRTFAAAAATVLVQVVAATTLFGPEIWAAFAESARAAKSQVLEPGAIGWEKIQSAFAFARTLGAPIGLAYVAQGLLALAVTIFVFGLWRSGSSPALKGAGLILGAVLATPYVVDYDLVLLAPAAALLIVEALRDRFRPYEKSALAFAFLAPLLARPIGELILVPLGLAAALAMFALVLARAERAGLGAVQAATA